MDRHHATEEDDWESQLADYVFGVMEPQAAERFERSLSQCREKVMLAQQYGEVMGLLGAAAPAVEPPVGHKTRLMSRIASTPQEPAMASAGARSKAAVAPPLSLTPSISDGERTLEVSEGASVSAPAIIDLAAHRERRRAAPILPWAATAAATLLFLVGVWGWLTAQSELTALRNTPSIPAGYVAFPIQGQAPMEDATAVVLVNPNKNEAFLFAQGLEPLPPDHVYELWLLPPGEGAKPVAAGTFKPDNQGTARHSTTAATNLSAFAGVAVSVEQAPGVSAPEGPIVLVGQYTVR